MESTASFGYWIRRQRKALDLTQQALADRVSCSLAAIKKFESDERRPSRQIAERLADVLGVPTAQREVFLRCARGMESVDQLSIAQKPVASPDLLPTGTVTFLYTDIEGSTKLWEQHPQAMASAHTRHDQILREAIESNHGYVFQVIGDAFCAAFPNVGDAVHAAAKAQIGLYAEDWQETSIRVRMGIHTGKADVQPSGQYLGYVTLSHVQRVMSVASGGQVLLSFTTHELLEDVLPEDTELRDLGLARLKDWDRTQHIFQLVIPGLPADFPPLRSPELLHNLPSQLTSFVGRTHELDETKNLLSKARLLTLTGPGGTGKTRLSLQLAAEIQERDIYPDGIWFVELAPIADADLVVQTVASTLGVRELPGRTILDALADYVRAKSLLLILDNCEHLVDACGQLGDTLLRASPRLKILASSREPLGIVGETTYRVPSLSLPDRDLVTPETSEALHLFVERATTVESGFSLTDQNVSDIAEICWHLDGIPLALELAAAQVSVFSPKEIAARLRDRFRLLAGGHRSAPPRHGTLRASIDWSYDLLSSDEQLLFRQLSVFNGGWTFEAAEAICPDLDVPHLLPSLIRKSLVMVDHAASTTRYHLLETIRQYAHEKLLEQGEAEQANDRFIKFFLQFAEEAEPHFNTFNEMEWMSLLEADYDNLRAVLDWAVEHDIMIALRLGTAIYLFWHRHGYEAEGHRLLSSSLARLGALPKVEGELAHQRVILQLKTLNAIGILSFGRGDMLGARRVLEESVSLARQFGEKYKLAEALSFMAIGRAFLGQAEGTYLMAEEGLKLAREINDTFLLGMALTNMAGVIAMTLGDIRTMQPYADEGLSLLREVGATWAMAMASVGMAFSAARRGNFTEARSRFEACMPLFIQCKDTHRVTMVKSELAHLERRQGYVAKAKSLYKETLWEWQQFGHRAAIAHELECMAMIAKAQEEEQRAVKLFGAAESLRETINIPMTPFERAEYDPEITSLRANMDQTDFTRTWSEGRALTMEQAITFALESEGLQFPKN